MDFSLSTIPPRFKIIEENVLISIYNRGFINQEPKEEKEVEILNKYRKEDIVRSFIKSLPIENWRYREHISIPSAIRQRPKILNFMLEIQEQKYPIYCIMKSFYGFIIWVIYPCENSRFEVMIWIISTKDGADPGFKGPRIPGFE